MSIVIANWKMNLGIYESVKAARECSHRMAGFAGNAQVVVCPSFVALSKVAEVLSGSRVAVGAQDMAEELKGAFTGDVSVDDLHSLGCRYVILGHSERRRYHGETDEAVNRKVELAVRLGMNPIVCVGESREERAKGMAEVIVERQLGASLRALKLLTSTRLIVAYEPIWATGTGTPSSASDCLGAKMMIEQMFGELGFPRNRCLVVYGGSASAGVAREFVSAGFEGFLVGTESKDPQRLFGIVEAIA